MRNLLFALVALALAAPATAAGENALRLELKDGDRVLWIGGTLVEREQIYGYWETLLTASYPDRNIKFRNLGWSGDTVWAESRGMFDPPAEGYKRMLAMAGDFKPTVIILAYGGNESFAGPAGLDRFITQYRKLVSDLKATGARFAFLLPVDMEPESTIDPALAKAFNKGVIAYRDAIRAFAAELQAPVIDLSKPAEVESALANRPQTSDGLQQTAIGYWALAHRLRDQVEPTAKDVTLPLPA
ncbi:MAG TPA: SGNH/GDSL hydrolase family protein, partial [Caulifigura sp.]|nr:SGNH/GDSL hydrolase family protein [Caulifigura sp.]